MISNVGSSATINSKKIIFIDNVFLNSVTKCTYVDMIYSNVSS